MSDTARTATIHPTVFVAPGAVVLGDVTLQAGASVWFNTVIRGDSAPVVVGEHTNLQDNSVVHEDEGFPALIGARVTVGHRSIIHGCVIEDDCLIGMGSVVLSGARIGAGSLVGASSLVKEGQDIPPASLVVGSPARVIGPVNDQHQAAIRNGASHYAELARSYMLQGLARGADRSGAITRDRAPMTTGEWRDLVELLVDFPTSAVRGEVKLDGSVPARIDRARLLTLIAALGSNTIPVWGPPPVLAAEARDPDPLEAWLAVRRDLQRRLLRLGPADWSRPIGHPTRGVMPLAEWVREWVEEDAELRSGLLNETRG